MAKQGRDAVQRRDVISKRGLLVSWTFIPSLIGCMLLMFGVVFTVEDNASTGMVLLALGLASMALWVWAVRRERRG